MAEEPLLNLDADTIKQIAIDVKADCIVTIFDKRGRDFWLELDMLADDDAHEGDYTVLIQKNEQPPIEYTVQKSTTHQFEGIIAEIVSDMIKKEYIKQNMKLLILTDRTLARKYNAAILVLDVDRVLYRIGKFDLAEHMVSETVIENIIDVAQEISLEGREGKKVGTLFVIGDPEELEPYLKQLIINPFYGHETELLNVAANSQLKESLKNFAQLDGAFVIDNTGNVLSAGTYLDVDTSDIKAYQGWGTKHLAATAITKVTQSVAVLVSESGGAVKVFKKGKLVLRMR